MNVSIAIATYNRAEELVRTLVSLAAMRPAAVSWEVLVVGNNCTDETQRIVNGMAPRFAGRLRYIEEPRQGLSHARNRAISEARYEIIAFLDDDVNVDPFWLEALCSAYSVGDVAAVGGRATLLYPGQRPDWLNERDEGLLTKVELGDRRRRATADELYGLNVSFRRDWLDRVGAFRVDLGRVGKCLMGGEETELLERIQAAGGVLLYEPAARVWHRVPPQRLHRNWFLSRQYWGQRGEAVKLSAEQVTTYATVRAWWWLVRETGLGLRDLLSPSSAAGFHRVGRILSRLGFAVGLSIRCAAGRPGRFSRAVQAPPEAVRAG